MSRGGLCARHKCQTYRAGRRRVVVHGALVTPEFSCLTRTAPKPPAASTAPRCRQAAYQVTSTQEAHDSPLATESPRPPRCVDRLAFTSPPGNPATLQRIPGAGHQLTSRGTRSPPPGQAGHDHHGPADHAAAVRAPRTGSVRHLEQTRFAGLGRQAGHRRPRLNAEPQHRLCGIGQQSTWPAPATPQPGFGVRRPEVLSIRCRPSGRTPRSELPSHPTPCGLAG
jgi:hypothetical protein